MRRQIRWTGTVLVLIATTAACSTSTDPRSAPPSVHAGGTTRTDDVRASLVQALGEHVMLAASATGHALAGRTKEFKATAAALENNSRDIADALSGPLDKTSADVFALWNSHIQMVVRYANATAADDAEAKEREIERLVAYAGTLGTLIGAATGLPTETVEELVVGHITSLKAVIDAQAEQAFTRAAKALREAYAHMDMLADPLAEAIAAG